ncbi:hypothetical protein [Fidelibacter multiformis]|uniref:hypothetical protein n=1 Tax=Fidelibacter multiformis TaxID=3377529 RepID=UPI0037DCF71E
MVRLWLNIQTPSAIKNSSGTLCRSIASQCSKKKSSHLLKSAKPGLKIERSEILERCAAAFNNSSGTSCRSIASLRSAFQHCFAVFKKEVQSPIEICKAGIEDRTK